MVDGISVIALAAIALAALYFVLRSIQLSIENKELKSKILFLEDDNLKLTKYAYTDTLTDLPSRRAGEGFIEMHLGRLAVSECTSNKRHDRLKSLGLMVLDIDFFKTINDRYGHGAGDEVLQACALAIRQSLRESDFVCRWGGEEFLVLLPNVCKQEATTIAEKVRVAVAGVEVKIEDEGQPRSITVTISIGVAVTSKFVDKDELFKAADDAVYEAKRLGRDQVFVQKNE